jgi:hypothetical protein
MIPIEEKIIFSKYVHDHLLQRAKDVVRFRHYVCLHCGTPVGNREVAMERLDTWLKNVERFSWMSKLDRIDAWLKKQVFIIGSFDLSSINIGSRFRPSIICSKCERRVPLWDEMEQVFASPALQRRVLDLQDAAAAVLEDQSERRALAGEVISAVLLAGQICREIAIINSGIDMEVEFYSDNGKPTGKKVNLQLHTGDNCLKIREGDGAEVLDFHVSEVHSWLKQEFPVVIVVRESTGVIRWMEVRGPLVREARARGRAIAQIVFEGERFDVMSVRRWRQAVLSAASVEL